MGFFQKLRRAYIGGRNQARLEESLIPLLDRLRGDEREAFSEDYEKTRKDFGDEIAPEGTLERTVYDFRFGMGRIGYVLARL